MMLKQVSYILSRDIMMMIGGGGGGLKTVLILQVYVVSYPIRH
jgi:hypothetical protein